MRWVGAAAICSCVCTLGIPFAACPERSTAMCVETTSSLVSVQAQAASAAL